MGNIIRNVYGGVGAFLADRHDTNECLHKPA